MSKAKDLYNKIPEGLSIKISLDLNIYFFPSILQSIKTELTMSDF